MKKLILLFFLSTTISVEAQTSIYHPFPDSNAIWNIDYAQWWACGPPGYLDRHEIYSYVLNGDTTINTNQYHKVYIPFVQLNCLSPYHTPGYAGCIRQDTTNRKVYFVYPNDSIDSLLYDFTLQVGDTIKGILSHSQWWLCGDLNPPLTISLIDSVLINNSYRKRWNYSGLENIIEGIGSMNGLLEVFCVYPDAPLSMLTCFKQNGLTLYPDSSTNCTLIDGIIDSNHNNISSFSLSPNPFQNFITIKNNQQKNLSITIFSSIGEVVQRATLIKDAAATINLSGLAAGIYLVAARTDKNFAARKIIKE